VDTLTSLLDGFEALLSPYSLIALIAGVVVGSLVGVLPGIGPLGAMAVLLPFSFVLEPTPGILMLAGIYYGAMYGGSTTSILLNLPGEVASVVTAIDGFEMTKRGRAGAALAVAAIGSFVAGTFATVALMLAAPAISDVALEFSAPDYLALTLFALLVLSRLTGGSFARTMVAVGLGLVLATVGLDETSGNQRFVFDVTELNRGVNITALAVGLFGIAEILLLAERPGRPPDLPRLRLRELLPTRTELRRAAPAMVRGSGLGFLLGLLPGPGPVVSTFASYSLERRISKHRREFGHGAIEGVAGPESANNGAAGGAMIPLLLLGVPFAAPTAILLGGFTVHGIAPGPTLIDDEPELFWGLIAGLYSANVVLLILNLPLVRLFTTVLLVPRDVMLAGILVFAAVGTFATENSLFDVGLLLASGMLGYLMVKVGLPRAALMLAFVIGDLMERTLVQTLLLGGGSPSTLLERPVAVVLLVATALVLLAPLVGRLLGRRSLLPPGTGE